MCLIQPFSIKSFKINTFILWQGNKKYKSNMFQRPQNWSVARLALISTHLSELRCCSTRLHMDMVKELGRLSIRTCLTSHSVPMGTSLQGSDWDGPHATLPIGNCAHTPLLCLALAMALSCCAGPVPGPSATVIPC